MFSTKEQLEKKTGPYGIGRLSYLQSLVTEFQDTNSQGTVNVSSYLYTQIKYANVGKNYWTYLCQNVPIYCNKNVMIVGIAYSCRTLLRNYYEQSINRV